MWLCQITQEELGVSANDTFRLMCVAYELEETSNHIPGTEQGFSMIIRWVGLAPNRWPRLYLEYNEPVKNPTPVATPVHSWARRTNVH